MFCTCKYSKLVFILVLFCCFGLYANDNTYQFRIKTGAVASYSMLDELVYEDKNKESEINWDSFRPGLDFGIDYSVYNFYFNISTYSAIPVEAGTVEDKDFFISGANLGKRAQYSKHDLITNKDYSFSLEAWYSLNIRRVRLGLGVNGIYSNSKVETDDGYLQYPTTSTDVWTGNEDKEYLNGTAISYEQSRIYGGIGLMLSSNWQYWEHFNFFVKGFWYPLLNIDAIDNHFLRSSQFCDTLHDKGHGFYISTGCSYRFNEIFGLNFTASYTYLETDGTTKTSPIGIITYNTTKADSSTTVGTKLSEFKATIGAICYL